MLVGYSLITDINACHPEKDEVAFWWLGQHGFVIRIGDAIIYVDPFLSNLPGRTVPPLLKPEEVTHATMICGSHDHADHIDRAAWPALAAASPDALFIVPELFRVQLSRELCLQPERVLGVDVDKTEAVAGVRITGVPAAHEILCRDEGTGLHPYLGFIIEAGGITLYHAGDTCVYEGMQELLRRWRLDIAFLPINGRDARRLANNCIGNMTYQEAVDLAGAIQPALTIPTHFDMFAMNSEDPQLFVDYFRVKYPELETTIPRHGERVFYRKKSIPRLQQ